MYGEEQTSEAAASSFTSKTDDVHCRYFSFPQAEGAAARNAHHDRQSCIYSSIRRFISSQSVRQLQCYKCWLFHLGFMALKMLYLEKIGTFTVRKVGKCLCIISYFICL